MLLTEQLAEYYPDLSHPALESALALVHSRFSTNTFPSWNRAHPYRYLAHNGEINTLRGNINWMHAAQSNFASELFGDDIKKIVPVINTDGSDSAMFDNCLELLVMAGRELPHAMMMMIPEPWENHESMNPERRAFYEYHSCLMEPWDGPASIAFTDGKVIGAVPRPQRPAPLALLRHQGRPGDHGVGSRRAAGGTGPRVAKGPPAAGPHVPRGHRAGPHRRRRGTEEQICQGAAVSASGWTEHHVLLERLPDPGFQTEPGPPDRSATAAGVWLHVRRSAFHHRPDGQRRRAAAGFHGHGHAAGGALQQAAAALQLFQAAVRAGHQPAD